MFLSFPITWCLQVREGDPDADAVVEAAHAAFEAWEEEAGCSGFDAEFVEECGAGVDIRVTNDADNLLADGVISMIVDGTIVVNDTVDWASRAEITDGTCAGQVSIDTALLHLVGDAIGLRHTCEEGDECLDAEDRAAVMYWSSGTCELRTLNDADVALLTAAYGPARDHEYELHELAVGEDLCVTFPVGADAYDVTWDFGDGAVIDGYTACHTYAEEGTYGVEASALNEDCGEVFSWATVHVCDVPHAKDGALFTYTTESRTTFQMVNLAVRDEPACIDTVQWDVFDSDGALVQSLTTWEPEITLEDAGHYRVVLNLGGPAGLVAEDVMLTVGPRQGCDRGRSSTLLPLVLLAGFRRRR